MARHRRRGLTAALGAAIILTSLATVSAPAAQADPNRIAAVRNQVMDLQAKAETATERYNQAQGKLTETESTLAVLKTKAGRQKRELNAVMGSVDSLARATYMSGGMDSSLQVLLANDPSQFLSQAAAVEQVAQAQSASIRRTQTARLRLAQTEAEVAAKEKIAQGVRNEMRSAKTEADKQLAAASNVLAGLQSQERKRLAALEAKERKASQAQAQKAQKQISNRPLPGVNPRAAKAVRYALSKVGNRYVAATAGPSTFDCSGLTMTAWRQAGVSLPHYSYSQYSKVRKISLSQAKPGDLVFYFGGSVHHVGMYIGGGKMVHAANPGDGVEISAVLGPWYRNYFTGVGRVL
ncbi:MAG: NlpC/P60 family protein [Actinomycetota bacterium]|nr:NlpC/P60 family protein [Actinomycetota bacterium]MDP2289037.1 NlpC/P60 family protein [Actinomycetota bacterium]